MEVRQPLCFYKYGGSNRHWGVSVSGGAGIDPKNRSTKPGCSESKGSMLFKNVFVAASARHFFENGVTKRGMRLRQELDVAKNVPKKK